MTAYLDASVIVPYVLTEQTTPTITAFIRGLNDAAIISSLAAGEFASAVARLERERRLTRDTVRRRLADFDEWLAKGVVTIETAAIDIKQAVTFVRRFDLGLRIPDAIHAATCARLGLTLVTFDTKLARVARTLGIDVVVPT